MNNLWNKPYRSPKASVFTKLFTGPCGYEWIQSLGLVCGRHCEFPKSAHALIHCRGLTAPEFRRRFRSFDSARNGLCAGLERLPKVDPASPKQLPLSRSRTTVYKPALFSADVLASRKFHSADATTSVVAFDIGRPHQAMDSLVARGVI